MSGTIDRKALHARALAALAAISDEEEAAIHAGALSDPDNPPLTDEQLARLRPAQEVIPHLLERLRGQRGPGRKPAKVQVALRLEAEVLDAWRATGPGWQTRMGEVLRKAVGK